MTPFKTRGWSYISHIVHVVLEEVQFSIIDTLFYWSIALSNEWGFVFKGIQFRDLLIKDGGVFTSPSQSLLIIIILRSTSSIDHCRLYRNYRPCLTLFSSF